MSYQPLHHKYRPQTFANLVGQETISCTLINAIEREKIAPAYLFTGPRGTGKTSSARILAKSLNCLASNKPTKNPCGECEVCRAIANGNALDTIEIDAASNTGVDNIRELIERSRFAPVRCRYKVYAIDECHMLSTSAFNALLKTLEEPPPNVVFILATTDPQRVLSTIISRCQRFDYRRIPLEAMTAHLKYIATEEQISIQDEAIALIAQIANGGLRDAESLLDQLSLSPDTITIENVWDLVGAVPERDLLKLLQEIRSDRHTEVIAQCRSLLDRGREPLVVLQNLASFYLNLLIAKTSPDRADLVAITAKGWQELCEEATQWELALILQGQEKLKAAETQLKQTTQPRLWLEVTLLGLLPATNAVTISPQKIAPASLNPIPASTTSTVAKPDPVVSTPKTIPPQPQPEETAPPIAQPNPVASYQPTPPQPEAVTRKSIPVEHQQKQLVETVTTNIELETAESETETSSTTPVTNSANNEKIWHQVISSVGSRLTQALLTQQCHLISLDESIAVIGISNSKLQSLHQGKVGNIENAFAEVCGRKIKVRLEVATKDSSPVLPEAVVVPVEPISNFSPQRESPKPPEKISISPQHNNIPQVDDSPQRIATIDRSSQREPQLQPKTSAEKPQTINVANTLESETSEIEVPQLPTVEDSLTINLNENNNHSSDELQQAIEELTIGFEGEVVQLDDTLQQSLQLSPIDDTEDNSDHSTPNQYRDHDLPQIKLGNRPNFEEYDDDF